MSVFIYIKKLGIIMVHFGESSTLIHAREQKTSSLYCISVFYWKGKSIASKLL